MEKLLDDLINWHKEKEENHEKLIVAKEVAKKEAAEKAVRDKE